MLRSLLKWLLEDLLILLVLLTASLTLPIAGFWMCRSSLGGTVFFMVAPFTTGVWCLLIVQLGGSRFWRGRAQVRAWREAHGGYVHTIGRGCAWLFGGICLSYAAGGLAVWLSPTPTVLHLFPCISYSPLILAFWRAYRG